MELAPEEYVCGNLVLYPPASMKDYNKFLEHIYNFAGRQ